MPLVHRRETAVTLVAAVIGGYLGSVLPGRVPRIMLRRFVIVVGMVMMAVFLGKAGP
ncbi:MAG: hypothetical protein ACRYGM_04375 [Janthinobacterium lividum]